MSGRISLKALVVTLVVLVGATASAGTYSGGDGSAENPYRIANAADVDELHVTSGDWDEHFILTTDVDLSGITYTTAVIAPDMDSSYGFQGTAFTGVFEGRGYSLLNLKINSSIADYVGLFGNIDSGKVKNLCLIDINIQADDYIGGLAGKNSGVIINCGVTGNVSGDDGVGGVCGHPLRRRGPGGRLPHRRAGGTLRGPGQGRGRRPYRLRHRPPGAR